MSALAGDKVVYAESGEEQEERDRERVEESGRERGENGRADVKGRGDKSEGKLTGRFTAEKLP